MSHSRYHCTTAHIKSSNHTWSFTGRLLVLFCTPASNSLWNYSWPLSFSSSVTDMDLQYTHITWSLSNLSIGASLGSAENTASTIVACWAVFSELLPGNTLIKFVTLSCWIHFNSHTHKSLISVIQILQSFKLLKQNFNTAWTAAPI
jgi:hypothetical protein